MAAINNSIRMQDRMTPVFRSIIKSMDSTLKVMKDLDAQANKGIQSKAFVQAEKNIKTANNALLKMQNNLSLATREATGLEHATGRVSRNMQSMRSGGLNLVNLSAGVYLLEKAAAALKSVMSAPDEARSTMARLGLFNESPYSNEQLYQEVYQSANRTRSDISDTGNLATRIMISGAMTGEGGAQGSLKVTEIINKALTAGGGTRTENQNAMRQLSQGLASGNLQGDELRSIREQTPYLMKVLSEGLGEVEEKFKGIGIGDMKKLGADGELTTERIVKAFLAMEDQVGEAFKKMPRTFGQNMTVITNVWKYWLYQMSMGDNALAKLNQEATAFADFLSSDAGDKLLSSVGGALNTLADLAGGVFGKVKESISSVVSDTERLNYAMVTLAAVAAAAALIMAGAWMVANWPIVLTVTMIYIIVKALYDAGISSLEFAQVIGGAFGYVAALIYNVFAWCYNFVTGIIEGIMYMFYDFGDGFGLFITNILDGIMEMVLTVADAIVSLVNMIPGVEIDNALGKMWQDTSADLRKKNYDKGHTLDRMDYASYDSFVNTGMDKGSQLINSMGGIASGIAGLANFDPSSMTLNGGNLDEVGKIGSSVDISDEDLKLLRDIAAREFLLNLSTVTPTASVSFGDVHETADVGKIMDVIEEMVENAFATQLVTE